MRAVVDAERQRLVQREFGKSERDLSEADVIEHAHCKEELAQMPELRAHYESLKQDEILAEAAAYIARARDNNIPVQEEFVRLVTLCEDLLKRNEQVAKERDRLRRERSRYLAKDRTSLWPVEQKKLLIMLALVITHAPGHLEK